MTIGDSDIADTLTAYLDRFPEETTQLAEPMRLLRLGTNFASRRTFPMHATVGALVTRPGPEILLIEHRAYGILLQPGGHIEPTDTTLIDAATRELAEETGIDPRKVVPASRTPVYVEYVMVPARPSKGEPAHYHLDFGFAFTTQADLGNVQESEVASAAWYPSATAERLVGSRVARAPRPDSLPERIPGHGTAGRSPGPE
ncbi:NUDIX hydrolase [Amycolatopsis sp. CA-230715]|uniref:NUDIX hydrolase n=1 Tax=Amycolatopsis sp. CA-230715 TaxID=2745196 RepID=UPI001C0115F0|nr:NUDIX domain-containing protein [Amycolatopsis sp. CA-230715]QWF85820.1 hypothetical protein HUW46_09300 [Amycolatopsis sp. CA-230715]